MFVRKGSISLSTVLIAIASILAVGAILYFSNQSPYYYSFKNDSVPLFKMQNTQNGDIILVSNEMEKELEDALFYVGNSSIGCIFQSQHDSTVPLYGVRKSFEENGANNGFINFYTLNGGEADSMIGEGWFRKEIIGWVISAKSIKGVLPIVRFYNPVSSTYDYATNDKEINNFVKNGWEKQESLGYLIDSKNCLQ